MMLKRTHSYYYQCQMQVVATDRCYCDFIIWSVTGELHCEQIFPDAYFISQQLELAEMFFYLAILLELMTPKESGFVLLVMQWKNFPRNIVRIEDRKVR